MTDRKSIRNPFEIDVVPDPESPSPTDVLPIHNDVFELCRNSYERVAGEHRSWSVLLYGEAGCGKTHLLSRFKRWLSGQMDKGPRFPAGLFVAVRMETGPGYLWRHLRRRFSEELVRQGPDRTTPLDHLLERYASSVHGGLAAAFEQKPVRDLGHDLMRVLESFSGGHHRRLCRAWLAGDAISEADLKQLNLPLSSPEAAEEDAAEYDARRIVLAITRLCAPAPVVFCFDQIEALGLSQQNNSYGAFSRMGASLIDEPGTGNTLVISTILASFLQNLQNGSVVSDYQRISKDQSDLQPLDWNLGKQLVDARLKSVLHPGLVLQAGPETTPVPEAELRFFYQAANQLVTPRRLIHEARRLFARWQGEPEKPRVSTPEFLQAELESLWSSAAGKPAAPDAILSQALPAALQLQGRSTVEKPMKHVDLATGSGASRVLIAYGNQSNMNSFGSWLAKVRQQTPAGDTLCVLRDAALPISPTARKSHERLREITQAGGRVVRVDAEALAALDAMRQLLARATSGDLNLDGGEVKLPTVRSWLAENLPHPAVALAQAILGGNAGLSESAPDSLLQVLAIRKVLPLAEAARLADLSRESIENYARAHPNRIALYGGPCPVVAQAIPAAQDGETVALD